MFVKCVKNGRKARKKAANAATPLRDQVPVIAPAQKPRQTNEQLAAGLARLKAALAGKMASRNGNS